VSSYNSENGNVNEKQNLPLIRRRRARHNAIFVSLPHFRRRRAHCLLPQFWRRRARRSRCLLPQIRRRRVLAIVFSPPPFLEEEGAA
jgi:hypothetical protein